MYLSTDSTSRVLARSNTLDKRLEKSMASSPLLCPGQLLCKLCPIRCVAVSLFDLVDEPGLITL